MKLGMVSAAFSDDSKGAKIFKSVCAGCHENGVGHAPAVPTLRMMSPASIYRVLTIGPMRLQTAGLSDADKKIVAEYLAGKNIVADSKLEPPPCTRRSAEFDFDEPPVFPAWGLEFSNARYVPNNVAGIDAKNIAKLGVKWTLGVAGGTRLRSHPALMGGAHYIGTDDGTIYALNRESGCLRWKFQAATEVRTGIIASSYKPHDRRARPIVYFGDLVGNVYAVDALSGKQVWSDHSDDHPSTTLTGSPVLY